VLPFLFSLRGNSDIDMANAKALVGVISVVQMPVDLFPSIRISVVVVATFYNGMPPEQIENDITGVTTISNLAMANLGRLPPGTLPPVVLKSDASSLPVCLVTLKGEGLRETQLRDLGQFAVRNQIARVPGASAPQPFGGKYRQIMIYVDPAKLEAKQLSVTDVVRTVNAANLILPAGQVVANAEASLPPPWGLPMRHGLCCGTNPSTSRCQPRLTRSPPPGSVSSPTLRR
jgi:multidrug efflux pump subunit AcrB